MRLTIVNQFYRPDPSPTAHLAASLAEDRARRGDTVTVIAGSGSYTGGAGRPAESRRGANPRVRRVWTPGLGKTTHLRRLVDYGAYYAFAAAKLLTMPRQDVIITLTTPPLIARAAALHKSLHPRTRLILWNMDCYPDMAERGGVMRRAGFAARFCHARNRSIYGRLDHLVCLDTAMADLLCGHYAPVNARLPVTIIPNWEDLAFFPADARPAPWPKAAELGLDGKFVILYLGNMGYGHDFATVLDAAESLRGEPVVFLFVGGGKRYQAVEEEKNRRGLANVIMHGYVPKEETPAVMGSAHAALVTLRDDSLGIMSPSKIHSNLATGLPLIYVGPRTSNVDEAVRHFGCGVSLRHGDAPGLVAFVRRMIADGAERERLRGAAREAFERAYCDAATLPLFDAAIRHALGGRPAGVPSGVAGDYGRATGTSSSRPPALSGVGA